MRARLSAVLFILSFASTAHAAELCGLTFRPPAHWTASSIRAEAPKDCAIGLNPSDWKATRAQSEIELPPNAVTIVVTREEVMPSSGFVRVRDMRSDSPDAWPGMADDDWLIASKATTKAERVSGDTWTGGIGEAFVGVDFKQSGRGRTSGVEQRAILVERKRNGRTAFLYCNAADCETTLPALLRSMNFSSR